MTTLPATHCPGCGHLLSMWPDGMCRICEGLANEPAEIKAALQVAYGDAPQTDGDRKAARRLLDRFERIAAEVVADATTAPNGCALCGVVEHEHGWRGHTPDGWQAPSDEVRRARMLARRAVADERHYVEINRRFAASV